MKKIKRYATDKYGCTRLKPADIFPELSNDDERMKKAIIDALNSHNNSINLLSSRGYSIDDVISYLEKQKVVDKEGMYYYLGGKFIYCGYPALENPYDFAMSQQEKKEQKFEEWNGEDERIRNEILEYFTITRARDFVANPERRKWISYIEKQKESIKEVEPITDGLNTEFQKQVSYLIASSINKEHEYSEGYVKWVSQSLLEYAKKESVKGSDEDERIRKWIIEEFKLHYDFESKRLNPMVEKALAYLEKQKDSPMPEDTVIFQKGVEEGRRLEREDLPYWQTFKGIGIIVSDDYILAKFGKGYKLLRPGDTIEIGTEFLQVSQLDNLPKEEQQKEQKPGDIEREWYNKGYLEGRKNAHIPARELGLPKKYDVFNEQKPAEKQDYSGLSDLERAIHRGFLVAGVENVPRTIIEETAKDCLAQMKPAELSEEDEEIFNNIIEKAKGGHWIEVNEITWLINSFKSLRLKPHWKPSEEQMRCLHAVVQDVNKKSLMSTTGYSPAAVLQSLYIDLKALM